MGIVWNDRYEKLKKTFAKGSHGCIVMFMLQIPNLEMNKKANLYFF